MTMDTKKFFDFTTETLAATEEVTHEDFVAIIHRLAHMTQDQLLALQEEVEIELNYRENMTSTPDDKEYDNDE